MNFAFNLKAHIDVYAPSDHLLAQHGVETVL